MLFLSRVLGLGVWGFGFGVRLLGPYVPLSKAIMGMVCRLPLSITFPTKISEGVAFDQEFGSLAA